MKAEEILRKYLPTPTNFMKEYAESQRANITDEEIEKALNTLLFEKETGLIHLTRHELKSIINTLGNNRPNKPTIKIQDVVGFAKDLKDDQEP